MTINYYYYIKIIEKNVLLLNFVDNSKRLIKLFHDNIHGYAVLAAYISISNLCKGNKIHFLKVYINMLIQKQVNQ